MRVPSVVEYLRAGSGRAYVVLLGGALLAFLLIRFGGVVAAYPVESVLVVILVCAVVTLVWACSQLLRGAARKVDSILDEELGPRGRSDGRRR